MGCANQQPPSGGEEDKTPPKTVSINPSNNSTEFKGNTIDIEFDKYVDRRSFQDAFNMSPPYKGEVDFNWKGKEVEIEFSKTFYKINNNKTFVVDISQDLKDIYGNAITEPIRFAFSTGPKIDKGEISGSVFNNNEKLVSIFAYKITEDITEFDPTKNTSDYFTQSSQNGTYRLTNLSPGVYRVIAVDDEDKNFLYTAERESYGVLPKDLHINDSMKISNVNFYIKTVQQAEHVNPIDSIIKDYFKDSLDIVYSSIETGSRDILPDESIFMYFNKYKPAREDFVSSFALKDRYDNPVKVVFNWHSDSLIEIFPPVKFEYNMDYQLSFKLKTVKDSVYDYVLKFKTAGVNTFGELKGIIRRPTPDTLILDSTPVFIDMQLIDVKPVVKYSYKTTNTLFDIKNLLEGDYNIFSFNDRNGNGVFDYGNPYPFHFSDPFYIYPKPVSIKGGWAVENLIIDFNK